MSRRQFNQLLFFRVVPILLLKRYFEQQGWLSDFDFENNASRAESLNAAWESLPDEARKQSEATFREIDALASERGINAILDDAEFHGEKEELLAILATLKGFHEKSFLIYLEHQKYWRVATAFFHADTISTRYWRKRKGFPASPAKVDDPKSIAALEKNLVRFFTDKEGRGKRCKVDVFRRGDLEYFFAYPEDHPRMPLVWKGQTLTTQLETPAFEIIFIFDKTQGSLDLYLDGDRRLVPELQKIFAGIMLDFVLTENEKEERVYNLSSLMSPDMSFQYAPESGITGVAVKKLRLSLHGAPLRRITLEATPTPENPRAVYNLLEQLQKSFPKANMNITQVGLVVTFAGIEGRRSSTRTFDLSWPNSCSLQHDEKGEIIRKMLADSGLEPRWPGM